MKEPETTPIPQNDPLAIGTGRRQQKQVYAAVQHIMTFDQHVSTWETTLLSELRLKFRV